MQTATGAAAARLAKAAVAALAVAGAVAWCAQWQSDGDVFEKAAGDAEALAPAWSGRGRVRHADLGAAARARISPEDLLALRTWADVCRAFADVPAPQPAVGAINSIAVPPIPQGDGTVRAHEVVVAQGLTGWRLATIRCGPILKVDPVGGAGPPEPGAAVDRLMLALERIRS